MHLLNLTETALYKRRYGYKATFGLNAIMRSYSLDWLGLGGLIKVTSSVRITSAR